MALLESRAPHRTNGRVDESPHSIRGKRIIRKVLAHLKKIKEKDQLNRACAK
jgi:hypothetical protein